MEGVITIYTNNKATKFVGERAVRQAALTIYSYLCIAVTAAPS